MPATTTTKQPETLSFYRLNRLHHKSQHPRNRCGHYNEMKRTINLTHNDGDEDQSTALAFRSFVSSVSTSNEPEKRSNCRSNLSSR